jgi:hypothetical protein
LNPSCEHCGAPLRLEARYCPICGQPVPASGGQDGEPESYPPIPSVIEATNPVSAPPQASNPPHWGWWIAGAALILIACCGLLVCAAGALAFYNLDLGLPKTQLEPEGTATELPWELTLAPTPALETPTAQPLAQPATPPSTPSGQQRWSETEFFDDFSSDELDWYTSSDENSQVGYENGAYAIEVKTADYRTLVRPPVQFLTHLEFNAQAVQGAENGTFGVACYYQDFKNYYFVEFDLAKHMFHIGYIENGDWKDLSEWLNFAETSEPMRYAVDCTPGMMSVYVNDNLQAEMPVSLPVEPHEMWLVVKAWSEAGPGGIKVLFDDVYGYKAMQ